MGYQNQGMTCYLNACLSVLLSLPKFLKALENHAFANKNAKLVCLLHALAKDSSKIVAVVEYLESTDEAKRIKKIRMQHDAYVCHFFLTLWKQFLLAVLFPILQKEGLSLIDLFAFNVAKQFICDVWHFLFID